MVGVKGKQSVDVVAFALGLAADRSRLLDRGEPESEIILGRRDMWIEQQAERNAPLRYCAFGIGHESLFENLFGRTVPKRMLVSHGPVEAPLSQLVARGREMHLAELLVRCIPGNNRLCRG